MTDEVQTMTTQPSGWTALTSNMSFCKTIVKEALWRQSMAINSETMQLTVHLSTNCAAVDSTTGFMTSKRSQNTKMYLQSQSLVTCGR